MELHCVMYKYYVLCVCVCMRARARVRAYVKKGYIINLLF